MRPASRVFDAWRMLPVHIRRSDTTGDLRAFVRCLQAAIDLVLAEQDRWLAIIDLRWAPEAYLDLLLADLGNPFPFALDLTRKRRLASTLVAMYRLKGTAQGIEQVLLFFAGLEVQIVPHLAVGARLGRSRLGRDFRLGSGERYHRYAFDVVMDRMLTEDERRQVRWLVEYVKPAHTHLRAIVEPLPVPPPVTWRLGHGRLGRSTLLERA
ncbi:MAG: hypothetical protein HS111_09735 [Kofleriaceae bacterium]|nr:hypothetical protein [Kofleriaceae bacterium]